MIVNDKRWRTLPVCVGEWTLATTAQVPIATPVRATRKGPQAAQVGMGRPQLLNPALRNCCESGQLCQDIDVIDLIRVWNTLGCDNPGDSSWRNLVKLTLHCEACKVPMLKQEVQMSRG